MNQIEAKKQKIEYLSHVIGLISFMVLGKLIGNNGIAYMAVLIECVSLFVLLVNGGSADLIGRMIRSRRKRNQYNEAAKLHKAYFLIQSVAAAVLMIIYFLLTDVFAEMVFRMPFLSAAMKMLAPVILLKTLQCLMQGYFQGMGAHMPTVVSSIFRQLLFLLFGLILAGRLVGYGEKVSALLNNADYTGMYGAVALSLAILISEILITVFLLIVYVGSDRKREKQRSEDGLQKMESFSERFRLIVFLSFPETVKAFLKKLPFSIGLFMVLQSAMDISQAAHEFGAFYGYFICVSAILVFLILTRIAHILNGLTVMVKRKDNRSVREVIYAGLHYCWAIGLYASVCMAVLAPQVANVVYKEHAEALRKYFTHGSAIIAVLIISIFIWRALYMLGADKLAYGLLALLNVLFVISCVVLRSRKMEVIDVLIFSALIAIVVECILSFVLIVRKYVLQPDMIRGFLIPVVAAGAMGLVVMLIRNLLAPHVGSLMCLILCLAFGLIVYMVVLVVTRSIHETEVNHVYANFGRKIFGLIIR